MMSFAFVVEVLVLFALAMLSDGYHPQTALPAFDHCAQQITTRSGLVHLTGDFPIALKLQLGFVKDLGGDDGRGFAQHPISFGAIAAAGLEITQLLRVPSAGWRIREIPDCASSPKTHS